LAEQKALKTKAISGIQGPIPLFETIVDRIVSKYVDLSVDKYIEMNDMNAGNSTENRTVLGRLWSSISGFESLRGNQSA
jgi:hypothetical protein